MAIKDKYTGGYSVNMAPLQNQTLTGRLEYLRDSVTAMGKHVDNLEKLRALVSAQQIEDSTLETLVPIAKSIDLHRLHASLRLAMWQTGGEDWPPVLTYIREFYDALAPTVHAGPSPQATVQAMELIKLTAEIDEGLVASIITRTARKLTHDMHYTASDAHDASAKIDKLRVLSTPPTPHQLEDKFSEHIRNEYKKTLKSHLSQTPVQWFGVDR